MMLVMMLTFSWGAAHANDLANVVGMGTHTCAQFAKDYQSDPEVMEMMYFTWAQGLMSGINLLDAMHNYPQIDTSTMSVEAQMAHIRLYCNEHPLAFYTTAVDDLMGAMAPTATRK